MAEDGGGGAAEFDGVGVGVIEKAGEGAESGGDWRGRGDAAAQFLEFDQALEDAADGGGVHHAEEGLDGEVQFAGDGRDGGRGVQQGLKGG